MGSTAEANDKFASFVDAAAATGIVNASSSSAAMTKPSAPLSSLEVATDGGRHIVCPFVVIVVDTSNAVNVNIICLLSIDNVRGDVGGGGLILLCIIRIISVPVFLVVVVFIVSSPTPQPRVDKSLFRVTASPS